MGREGQYVVLSMSQLQSHAAQFSLYVTGKLGTDKKRNTLILLSNQIGNTSAHQTVRIGTEAVQEEAEFHVLQATSRRLTVSMAGRGPQLLGKISYKSLSHSSLCSRIGLLTGLKPTNMATIATYKVPKVENENNVSVYLEARP